MEIPFFASYHRKSWFSVPRRSGEGAKGSGSTGCTLGSKEWWWKWRHISMGIHKESFSSDEALSSSWRCLLAAVRWQQLQDTLDTWLKDSNFLDHYTDLWPCPKPHYIRINDSPGKKKGFLKTGDVTAKDMLAYVRNCGEIGTDRLFLRRHQRIFRNMAYLETFFSFKWSLLEK